jgi:hypothetical protein
MLVQHILRQSDCATGFRDVFGPVQDIRHGSRDHFESFVLSRVTMGRSVQPGGVENEPRSNMRTAA